jgi:hypothetical protein
MASLALVSKYGIFPLDWQYVDARFDEIIRLLSSTSILLPSTTYGEYKQTAIQKFNGGETETHKRKALWVARVGLDKELIAPAIQRFEALGVVHIVHQHAAVRSSVEGDA